MPVGVLRHGLGGPQGDRGRRDRVHRVPQLRGHLQAGRAGDPDRRATLRRRRPRAGRRRTELMTRMAKLLAGAVAVMLVASTLAFGADKTTLRLDWKAYGSHAPFALGIDKGMYRDEGIELELAEGTGSGTGVKLIANGSDA